MGLLKMDIAAFIAARLAAPNEWRVTTSYADGSTRTLDVESVGQAETHAVGERRLIGRDLISRETGAPVRVVAVRVGRI